MITVNDVCHGGGQMDGRATWNDATSDDMIALKYQVMEARLAAGGCAEVRNAAV